MAINCNPYNNRGDSGLRGGHNLFDPIITDHILTREEAAYAAYQGTYTLTADTAAYAKAIEEKEAATQQTITVGEYSFTGYTNSNGHIFYDISEKPIVDNIYEATGKAYYFGIDTENKRVFLPRVKHVTLGMGNLTDTIRAKGNGKAAGLTNGKNNYGLVTKSEALNGGTWVELIGYTDSYGKNVSDTGGTKGTRLNSASIVGITLDSAESGIVLDGQSIEDVSQPAYLYFCVGNTIVNTANIDAEKLTGDIRKLEANKVDINSNVIDGQWKVFTDNPILSDLTVTATRQLFDISNFIPNDGNAYEVISCASIKNSSGINVNISAGFTYTNYRASDTASHIVDYTLIFSPQDRSLGIVTTSGTGHIEWLRFQAYRRLGTNV